MIGEDKSLDLKRKKALESLRSRPRDEIVDISNKSKREGDRPKSFINTFISLENASEIESKAFEPEEELLEIRQRLQTAKSLKRESRNQQKIAPESNNLAPESQPETENHIREVISGHFKSNVFSWLGNVDSELGISSTSIEELENIQKEVRYRHKLLTAMLKSTEKELDNLEVEIRAKKAIQEN